MEVDQNYHKVKKFLFILFLFFLILKHIPKILISKNFRFRKSMGSTFINNEELLITEKFGKIKLINLSNNLISEIQHNINFIVDGQGGLLDVIYKDNHVWISYSENRGGGKSSTSIAKGKFNKIKINFENIFQANPPIKSGYHFGSRLAIKDDYLFATSGERGGGMIAQDPTNHIGKIIRIHLDGSIPNDNPKFEGKSEWLPEIYQLGVRNPQGLTLSNFDQKIYASNHGAMGGDWFGEIKKGENYGWKILGWGGKNYSGIPIGPKWEPGLLKRFIIGHLQLQ